jgi:hypothetical protein
MNKITFNNILSKIKSFFSNEELLPEVELAYPTVTKLDRRLFNPRDYWSYDFGDIPTGGENIISLPKSRLRFLILGASKLSKSEVCKVASMFGIDKEQLDIYSDYSKIKRLDWKKITQSNKYSAILKGPIAHKVRGLEFLSEKTSESKIHYLKTAHQLKITKQSLESAFTECMAA